MAKPHRISLPTATAIVVANMVGTGVFVSLGFQAGDLPSGFVIVLLWLLGGLLSFCGAVSYAELGAMLPRSGGEYHLLREAYHPLLGFLGGWVSSTVGFAVPVAAATVAFEGYVIQLSGQEAWGRWAAYAVVAAITAIHCGNLRHTERFQVAFTLGKVMLIVILIVAGLSTSQSQPIHFLPQAGDGALIAKPAFAVSLVFVMYAYAGWNAAAYIVGELDRPQRTLPLALFLGTGFVTLLYVLLNATFLRALPLTEISQSGSDVALVASRKIFGERGGFLMGCFIAFGLISTISSMTWAGPRVTQTMGEDFRPFRIFARVNRHGMPWIAILTQGIIVAGLLSYRVDTLIYYIQGLLNLSSALVVAGVFVLRLHRPDAHRPYRAWGYPITPLLFLVATLWILVFQVRSHPMESLLGLITLAIGWLLWNLERPRLPAT